MNISSKIETATLAAGCFWCTEAVFAKLKGVAKVTSGYAGGAKDKPTYEEVSTGTTGHAEAIQIEFDPSVISYKDILDVFWHTHDPTTPNQQGADIGPQYRSMIFYHSPEQQNIAEESRRQMEDSGQFPNSIVTEIVPFENFYPAEDDHQDFYKNNPSHPYCIAVIDPKLQKLMNNYGDKVAKE